MSTKYLQVNINSIEKINKLLYILKNMSTDLYNAIRIPLFVIYINLQCSRISNMDELILLLELE